MKNIILNSLIVSSFVSGVSAESQIENDTEQCIEIIKNSIKIFNDTFISACDDLNIKMAHSLEKDGKEIPGIPKHARPCYPGMCSIDVVTSIEGARFSADVSISGGSVNVVTSNITDAVNMVPDIGVVGTHSYSDSTSDTTDIKATLNLGIKFQLQPDVTVKCVNPLTHSSFERARIAIIESSIEKCKEAVRKAHQEEEVAAEGEE